MKRIIIAVLVAIGVVACTRVVVLDPQPDSGALPDSVSHNDGGLDGFVQDAGSIGDAALAD